MYIRALKFFGVALIFVLVGAGIVWGIGYYQYLQSPEYQIKLNSEKLQAAAKVDIYGGSTPEETLALFVDALKKGNIDLASKYFVVDKEQIAADALLIQKQNGTLAQIVDFALQAKNGKSIDDHTYFLNKINQDPKMNSGIVLIKGLNNKWKIAGF